MTKCTPKSNEIWYTNGSTTKATVPHKLDAFGANIISNVYDHNNQCWVISFDKEIRIIGERAFASCVDLIQVVLPDSITIIDKQAFSFCLGLKEIPKAKNVAYYGFSAFQSCNSLCIVDIPESVKTIKGFVFFDCRNLRKVTIPKSVKEIGLRAFSYKQQLTKVYCKAIIPPSTLMLENQWNAFDYYDNDNVYPRSGFKDIFCKIFVPTESLSRYKSAPGWSYYADHFIGYNFENDIVESNSNFKAKPFDNEILYTNGSTEEPTIPCRLDSFKSKILSNIYDAEKECWIMTFEYNLTKIDKYAFSCCFNINSIILPNTIEVIEERAFEDCSGLTSVTLGKGVSEIQDFAFYGCKNITDIIIPDNVTSIGCNPFYGCIKLSEFRGKYASEDRKYLIKDDIIIAFAVGCGDKECFIPNTITSIGNYSFSQCNTLTYIEIPNTVRSIGDSAFSLCGNLININIPDSVISIGKYAFGWCKKLTDVVIPNSVIIIGESAFQTCYGLRSMIIPDSVIEIGEAAFIWCTNLKSVHIPNSVRVIGQRAFKSCLKLTSINIPETLTTISHRTFYECELLTSIIIPKNITLIEDEAFGSCWRLKTIYCQATIPPVCKFSMFHSDNDTKIYVPIESLELYKSASNWSQYSKHLVGYNFDNN